MKYLIIRRGMADECLLFGGTVSHKELASDLGGLDDGPGGCKILGAGVCWFNWDPQECEWAVVLEQGSVSLNMEKKEEDIPYIKFALNQ